MIRPRRSVRSRAERGRLRDGLVLLVVLAAVAAGWFGWSWYSAANDTELALAKERDAVLRKATQALVTLNTVDHRTAEQDVAQWVRVSTGRYGAELAQGKKSQVDKIKKSRTVATANVVNAAVAELNAKQGTARVIAVLDIRLRGADQQRQKRHSLLEAELRRTDSGWKVASVQGGR